MGGRTWSIVGLLGGLSVGCEDCAWNCTILVQFHAQSFVLGLFEAESGLIRGWFDAADAHYGPFSAVPTRSLPPLGAGSGSAARRRSRRGPSTAGRAHGL